MSLDICSLFGGFLWSLGLKIDRFMKYLKCFKIIFFNNFVAWEKK